MSRILVFTPTHGAGPDPRTLASVAAQETTVPFHHHVNWLKNPAPGRDMGNVLRHYQEGREMALAGDYEALLTVEHDMILPPNALQRLYETAFPPAPGDLAAGECNAPVVYGVYLLRHGMPVLSAWRYNNRKHMGLTLSMYPDELQEYRQRGWGIVSGVGWGCTLIRREVLKQIQIRPHDRADAGDVGFAHNCLRQGIAQIARFDVLCGHICDDGTVLMPFADGGVIGRVYALRDAPTGFHDIEKPMVKGRYYSMPFERAQALKRAGYVNITNLNKGAQLAAFS